MSKYVHDMRIFMIGVVGISWGVNGGGLRPDAGKASFEPVDLACCELFFLFWGGSKLTSNCGDRYTPED